MKNQDQEACMCQLTDLWNLDLCLIHLCIFNLIMIGYMHLVRVCFKSEIRFNERVAYRNHLFMKYFLVSFRYRIDRDKAGMRRRWLWSLHGDGI